MVKRRKLKPIAFRGFILPQGSKKKNLSAAKERIKSFRFKGKFKVKFEKPSKKSRGFIPFVAVRR